MITSRVEIRVSDAALILIRLDEQARALEAIGKQRDALEVKRLADAIRRELLQ